MRRSLMAVVLLLVPTAAVACLWDRDTPADEARGLPEVVAVIAGRFERNPPRFYEIRLGRVAALIREQPDELAAYDDAGVACDRLGRGDEAIAWMAKKREQLERRDANRPEVKEHWYRYHANLGTFLVHRWARDGADRAKIAEVEAARAEIARALEINPNAHFGREKYQLRALGWIIDPPKVQAQQTDLPNLLGWNRRDWKQQVDPGEAHEAVRGLAGLIVLGNAWESVDVFYALEMALHFDSVGFPKGEQGGRNSLAYLAWFRCRELIDAGKGSMLPDAPKGEDLKQKLFPPDFVETEDQLKAEFLWLRAEADAWQAARLAFMAPRLAQGRHPDTDPRFWDGYRETPPPGLAVKSPIQVREERMRSARRASLAQVFGVSALLVGAVIVVALRRKARGAKVASPDWSG